MDRSSVDIDSLIRELPQPPPIAFYAGAGLFAGFMAALSLFEYANGEANGALVQILFDIGTIYLIALTGFIVAGLHRRGKIVSQMENLALDLAAAIRSRDGRKGDAVRRDIAALRYVESSLIRSGAYSAARRVAAARREVGDTWPLG
ncbi:hypothetical protein AB0M39_12510 [Streptomyces sp. NPDC051907]|uniref:hypothetical protein n=1 Tax=Streptomyces sp. NPDC051907 TaxID=3155284 RepID=UPI00341D88F5